MEKLALISVSVSVIRKKKMQKIVLISKASPFAVHSHITLMKLKSGIRSLFTCLF